MNISELLTDYIYEEDSQASQQAKQMRLVYKGFGRWADSKSGQITHKTQNGKLIPIKTNSKPTLPKNISKTGTGPEPSRNVPKFAIHMKPSKHGRSFAKKVENHLDSLEPNAYNKFEKLFGKRVPVKKFMKITGLSLNAIKAYDQHADKWGRELPYFHYDYKNDQVEVTDPDHDWPYF